MRFRRLVTLTMLLSACGSTEGSTATTAEGGAGSGSTGAGGSGASGGSGSGGASVVDSGGGGGIVQGTVMEEPQGTAVDLPCDALLAVGGADLFFLTPSAVFKIGPASEMRMLVVGGAGNMFQGANGFAIDAGFVYWSDYRNIFKMSQAGGVPTQLPVSNKDVISGPNELAVHDTFLYFSHINDGNLYRVAIDGGSADQLVGTYPISRRGTSTNGIAVLGTSVYWAFDDLVLGAPAGGGMVTTVAKASKAYAALFGAADTSIYWSGPEEGFMRTTLPSDSKSLLPNLVGSRIGAFDGVSVFGVQANAAGNPHVVAVPGGGGATTDVAAVGSKRTPKQLRATTQHIYWTAERQCASPFECPQGMCDARRIAKP